MLLLWFTPPLPVMLVARKVARIGAQPDCLLYYTAAAVAGISVRCDIVVQLRVVNVLFSLG